MPSKQIRRPEEVIAKINNKFSFKLFKLLATNDNDVMSSLAVLSAFSILMNGTKGETLVDMKRFLKFKTLAKDFDEQTINEGFEALIQKYGNTDQNIENKENMKTKTNDYLRYELNLANLLVHSCQSSLIPEFTDVVNYYFRGETQSADFLNTGTIETNKINKWVRNKTNNKIKKVLDHVDQYTNAIMVTVLHFKAHWKDNFSAIMTRKADFYNNGVNAVLTNTMSIEKPFNYALSSELEAQLIELDYMGDDISLVIVLPNMRNGLKSLKKCLNLKNFNKAVNSMTMLNIKLFLPKFRVEKSYDIVKELDLNPIALTRIANLWGTDSEPIIVSKIQHKVLIEVNEKGTEATAVTAINAVINSGFIPFETILVRVDHPFLYFIRDKSNSVILFSGQINKL